MTRSLSFCISILKLLNGTEQSKSVRRSFCQSLAQPGSKVQGILSTSSWMRRTWHMMWSPAGTFPLNKGSSTRSQDLSRRGSSREKIDYIWEGLIKLMLSIMETRFLIVAEITNTQREKKKTKMNSMLLL